VFGFLNVADGGAAAKVKEAIARKKIAFERQLHL